MKTNINQRISLLSFDLDGTLLNSNGEISSLTLSMIQEVMKKGIKVTLSSGRVPPMLKLFADIINIKGPYVAGNGSLIVNNANNIILYNKPMLLDNLIKLCNYCLMFKLHYTIQTNDILYYTRDNPRIPILIKYNNMCKEFGLDQSQYVIINNQKPDYASITAYKVIVLTNSQEQFQLMKAFLDQNKEFGYTYSMVDSFEITAEGTSKGKGIKIVADYYGIPMSEVCAFGDYDNDISIFETVGINVAMGNSSENLKKIAMYHTTSNDKDGIAKALLDMRDCFY